MDLEQGSNQGRGTTAAFPSVLPLKDSKIYEYVLFLIFVNFIMT